MAWTNFGLNLLNTSQRLPLRGQLRLGVQTRGLLALLIPVELQPLNAAVSTNKWHCKAPRIGVMATHEQLEQLTQRVERLLLRHEELQRANGLLQDELDACHRDRDLLKMRLSAAKQRMDALIAGLPQPSVEQSGPSAQPEDTQL